VPFQGVQAHVRQALYRQVCTVVAAFVVLVAVVVLVVVVLLV
jgi:hypothetical protein